jgi:tetratricopeptide (TPR) repeat protein
MSPVGTPRLVQEVLGVDTATCALALERLIARGLISPLVSNRLEVPRHWQLMALASAPLSTLALVRSSCATHLAEHSRSSIDTLGPSLVASTLLEQDGRSSEQALLLSELARSLVSRGLIESAVAILGHLQSLHPRHFAASQSDVLQVRLLADLGLWNKAATQAHAALSARVETDSVNSDEVLELHLISLEIDWRQIRATSQSIERALAYSSNEALSSRWRLKFALFAARMSANWCRVDTLTSAFEIARAVPQCAESEELLERVRLIYETLVGSLDTALAISNQLVARASARGDKRMLANEYRTSTLPLRWLGRIEDAVQRAQVGLSTAQEVGDYDLIAQCLDTLATLWLEQRRVDEAVGSLAALEATGMLALSKWRASEHAEVRAHLLLELGRYADALECAEGALRDYDDALPPLPRSLLQSWRARAAIALRDLPRVSSALADLQRNWEHSIRHIGGVDSVARAIHRSMLVLDQGPAADSFLSDYVRVYRRRRDQFQLD